MTISRTNDLDRVEAGGSEGAMIAYNYCAETALPRNLSMNTAKHE